MRDRKNKVASSELSNEGLSHRTYVTEVLRSYSERDIVLGDPNEGTWHEAHYPVPKRLGGKETILLLEEHHAVQGVLQSEEFDCCCVTGKFDPWLRGTKWEDTYLKWLSVLGAEAGRKGGTAAYKKRGHKHVEAAAKARRKTVVVEKEGFMQEFPSLTEACKNLGLTKSALCSVISGTRNHHKGFKARYV